MEFDDAGSDESMDMENDPRFTTETVLDRRLRAFRNEVGLVGGLTTGASLSQCFKLEKTLHFGLCDSTPAFVIWQSSVHLISFLGMSLVLFLSLYATLVSVNQSYFGNRLMTAGANGFELGRAFYMKEHMVRMRHRAIRFLARALILLIISTAGMLYVKFAQDQDMEAGLQDSAGLPLGIPKTEPGTQSGFCSMHLSLAGIFVLAIFCAMSFYLYFFIQVPHEQLFREIYALRYQQADTFGTLLEGIGQAQVVKREDLRSGHRRPVELEAQPVNSSQNHGSCATM